MKKNFLVLLILVALTGCTTVSYNGGEQLVNRVSYPEVGEVMTVGVGEHMVEKGSIVEVGVLRVNRMIDGALYDIPNMTYRQIGHDSENDFYEPTGVVRGAFADPIQALAVAKKSGAEICVITTFGTSACYAGDYEKSKRLSEQEDSFQQTLIYNGRVGDRINIGYREFSSSLARPAFNNEVEYDLSTSNEISYKGASLEVIEAGNSGITYRLIRNFPD